MHPLVRTSDAHFSRPTDPFGYHRSSPRIVWAQGIQNHSRMHELWKSGMGILGAP